LGNALTVAISSRFNISGNAPCGSALGAFAFQGSVMIAKFLKDEGGATAIEYGLIAALIAVACIVALEAMGTALSGMFTGVKTKLDAAKPQ
jgi:pilus assembly protein Flp/PilA